MTMTDVPTDPFRWNHRFSVLGSSSAMVRRSSPMAAAHR
jgi:hypothetical protein